MLVLSRKVNETIKIGDDIEIRVLEVKGDTIRIGINAPKSMDILRGELILTVSETNTEANELNEALFYAAFEKELKSFSKKAKHLYKSSDISIVSSK